MAEAVVSIVVGRLTDLLTQDAQLLHGVKHEIQQLVTELRRIKTFLPDADLRLDKESRHSSEYEKIRILVADVRELAYDAEHVVETFLVKASASSRASKRRKQENKYRRKMKDIQRKMLSVIYDRFGDYNIRSTLEYSPESSDSCRKLKRFHTFTTVEPDIFVGFQKDVDRLVGYLVDESDHDSYPVISICGMGGLGKTTLAEKIYNHSIIKNYFAGLAWVYISQKWQTKRVLQRILICLVHDKKEEILTWDDDKLVNNLLQIQQKKKCLIVLDDIWSNDAWDSIKAAFTAEKSLSKLMLTSRKVDVAEYVNPKGLVHQPGFLSADQSWELLQLKALPTRGDYLDIARDYKRMEQLGREMVKNCAGLPLAIVILGGVLVTKPSLIEWEKVYYDSLPSLKEGKGLGLNQQEQLFNILARSYNDLPPQLKPCFLYLGKFMEDEWINAETLYQLWIAEGLVLSSDKREGETMMQVAESYLGELVHKSMVQVRFDDIESSVTKFKSCSLHDLMRDLSLSQTKAVEFFGTIDLREGNDFDLSSLLASTRQLVVYCDENYRCKTSNSYFVKKPDHQHYRSMLLLKMTICRSLPPVLGSHFANFRLLRVLALENVFLDGQTVSGTLFGTDLGKIIGSLVYLRYLSVRNSNLMILPWIQKLVLLQTLKVDEHYARHTPSMSNNILGKMAHLGHLYLPEMDNCKIGKNLKLQFNGLSKLEMDSCKMGKNLKLQFNGLSKLETLENFNTEWCEVKDLPLLTSLQRLKLKVSGDHDNVEEHLKYLATLASSSTSCLRYLFLIIDIFGQGFLNDPDTIRQMLWNHKFSLKELTIKGRLPELAELFEQQQRLNFTHIDVSLIRITSLKLWKSRLEKDPMPVLEKIPTLRVLQLSLAYEGKEIVCSGTGFPQLTRLILWKLPNLEKWRVEEGSMPILQHLTIDDCPELEELPEGLVFLHSLRKLKLTWMPSEFCNRVRVVNGEQGPDFYKVSHIPDLSIN